MSPNDKVVRVGDPTIMPYSVPRVHFSTGRERCPKLLSDSEAIQLQRGQYAMDLEKTDTKSEGGSLSPNDEVVREVDPAFMPYSVPRVHFATGKERCPKLLTDSEVIQRPQHVMDLSESDCESEGDTESSEDETVCRGAEQSAMDVDSSDLCGPMAALEIAPRESIGKGVILLNVKTRTLYAKSYLIYDSGASVHHPNKWLDTETATRIRSSADNKDVLTFKRGLEGLLVRDVASMTTNRYRRSAYTFPTIADFRASSPRVGSVEGSVPEWLERLGLTAREAQASIALEVFSCTSRERAMFSIMECMDIAPAKRDDIVGLGSLIKGSGKSTQNR